MQKVNQSESSHEIEMREAQAVSPDSMVREEGSSEALPSQSGWRCYWKQCTFLAMLLLCSMMFGYEINTQKVVREVNGQKIVDDYDFMVFCPATVDDLKPFQNTDLRRRLLTGSTYSLEIDQADATNYLAGRTYLVKTQSRMDGANLVLEYCGRMRLFEQDCAGKEVQCAASPMFDISTRDSVDIVWVNDLDPSTQLPTTGECVNDTNTANDQHCSLMTKVNSTRTFVDPTTHTSTPAGDGTLRISYNAWPISTHVHGAEVRPAFDGNPLSWITNNKNLQRFGVGTFSLHEKCYFDSFQQSPDIKIKTNPPKFRLFDQNNEPAYNFKVNRYPNKQNPGTLWYHDHAMRLTSFNVQKGLAGFYILRDPEVQQYLGIDRSNEKFVLITGSVTNLKLDGLVGGTVYRFRFLNANYNRGMTFRYFFSYNNCADETALQQFTLIGADSSLFDIGIEHQKHFVLSNAERIDLLIKFASEKTSFSICADTKIDVYDATHEKIHIDSTKPIKGPNSIYNIKGIQLKKYSQSKDLNTRTDINNIDLSPWVAYTDLSTKTDDQIAVKRFRPLMFAGSSLTINGRVNFHSGWSEQPMIGSTQDWFLINAFGGGHPIHVHLINFQVIKVYDLKLFGSTTYYQMDFVAEALKVTPDTNETVAEYKKNVFTASGINYTYLNASLSKIKSHPDVVSSLSKIHPENQVVNKVSGMDLFAKDGTGVYKYITGEGQPSPKVFYSKWKDTAYVDGYKALQYRIRWAKSNFDEKVDPAKGTYFHVPADQLREYPGYVYHCHILDHEDNEMMRPIMLQMPETALSASAPCNFQNWAEKVKCINLNCGNITPLPKGHH